MTKAPPKKPVVKIGNAKPKSKLDHFKDRVAESVEALKEVVQATAQDESVYLPPAMVRKPPPAPAKKNPTPTGKLDFSTIKGPTQGDAPPFFDAARYLKK